MLDSSFLILFSIGTGAMLSPPAVTISSFTRPLFINEIKFHVEVDHSSSDRTALTLAIGSHLHLFCQYHHSCTTLHLGELLWLPSRLCDIPWRCCDLCCISHHIPLHQGPVFCSENNTMLNSCEICPGGFKLHFPTFTPTCSLPTLPGLKQPKSGLLVACGPQVSEQPNTSCVQIWYSLD